MCLTVNDSGSYFGNPIMTSTTILLIDTIVIEVGVRYIIIERALTDPHTPIPQIYWVIVCSDDMEPILLQLLNNYWLELIRESHINCFSSLSCMLMVLKYQRDSIVPEMLIKMEQLSSNNTHNQKQKYLTRSISCHIPFLLNNGLWQAIILALQHILRATSRKSSYSAGD